MRPGEIIVAKSGLQRNRKRTSCQPGKPNCQLDEIIHTPSFDQPHDPDIGPQGDLLRGQAVREGRADPAAGFTEFIHIIIQYRHVQIGNIHIHIVIAGEIGGFNADDLQIDGFGKQLGGLSRILNGAPGQLTDQLFTGCKIV